MNVSSASTTIFEPDIISTFAGTGVSGYSSGFALSSQMNTPYGIAFSATGSSADLYIADANNNVIRQVNATAGTMYTIIGNQALGGGYSGDGGPAISAQVYTPVGLAVDAQRNLYIADTNNNVIRMLNTTTGIIFTVAGNQNLGAGYSGDGRAAINAQLNNPTGVAVDSTANIFIADYMNNIIRFVNVTTGIILTIAGMQARGAGYSGDHGLAVNAQLNLPTGIFVDSKLNLFIADTNNNVIRRVDAATGIILTIAGNYTRGSGFSGDGGLAISAQLTGPTGVIIDSNANIYIADTNNNVIRKVNSIGLINTIVGNFTRGSGYSGDNRLSTSAQLAGPTGIIIDSNANLYIADTNNNVIRKVNASSSIPLPFSCSSPLNIVNVDGVLLSVFPHLVNPYTFSDACFMNNGSSANANNINPVLNLPSSVSRSVVYACSLSGLASNLTQALLASTSLIMQNISSQQCRLDLPLSSQVLYCDTHSQWIGYQLTAECSSSTISSPNELAINSQKYIFVASFVVSNIAALPPLFLSSSSAYLDVSGIITQYMLYVLQVDSSILSAPFTVMLSPYANKNINANANSTLTTVTITFSQSSTSFPLFYTLQAQMTHNNSLIYLTPLGPAIVPHSATFSFSIVQFLASVTNLSPLIVSSVGICIAFVMFSLFIIHRRYYPLSHATFLCTSILSLLNAVCCAGYVIAAYSYSVDNTVNDTILSSLCIFAIISAFTTATINMFTATYSLTVEYKSSTFRSYVRDNIILVSIVTIMSAFDLANIMIICTRTFYLNMFSATLSKGTTSRITIWSCVTSVWLSTSTFIISAYVCKLDPPNTFTSATLVASGLSMLVKFARLYFYMLDIFTPTRSTSFASVQVPMTSLARNLTEKQKQALVDLDLAHKAAINRIINKTGKTFSEHDNPLAERA